MSMSNLDTVTQKMYKKFHNKVEWDTLTEQECQSYGRALTKVIADITAIEQSGEPLIAPVRGMNTARKEAMIMLSVDIAVRGLELMLRNQSNNQ